MKSFYCLIFLSSLVLASALNCYDCDGDKCKDVKDAIDTPCDQNAPICLSAAFDRKDQKKIEVNRGCRQIISSPEEFCNDFKKVHETENIKVVSCVACNSERCNDQVFSDDGKVKGSASIQKSIVFLAITSFVSLLILQ